MAAMFCALAPHSDLLAVLTLAALLRLAEGIG